jgi:hypothetical protein
MLSMPRIVRPDPDPPQAGRNSVPPLDRLLADPLSETKNCGKSLLRQSAVNENRELLLRPIVSLSPTYSATVR